jgi:hypothetical protein
MEIGSPASDSSEGSELVVYEPAAVSSILDILPDAPVSSHLDPVTPELTAHVPGDNATHHNHGPPAQQFPQFDPRALLNPASSTPKRPASSGADTDRGRADPTIAGQVSLVERLHNVQERTSSPAKRVKTEDPRRQKIGNRSNFAGGSALELQNQNSQPPAPLPQKGPAIDLTMSDDEDEIQIVGDNSNEDVCIGKLKQTYIQAHLVPFPDPKKFAGNHGGQSRIKVAFRRGGGHKGNQIIMVRSLVYEMHVRHTLTNI